MENKKQRIRKTTDKTEKPKSFDAKNKGIKKRFDTKKNYPIKNGEIKVTEKKVSKVYKRRETEGLIRLNKYISNAGICSRRDADILITSGSVTVNGEIITELGYKIKPEDKVGYDGKELKNERKVYLLLNKPKDYITTSDDPQQRKTVLSLIKGACKERIYPVGRLDRLTTGLLLFTNDGDMAKKLTHPKHKIKKIYHVVLNKNLTKKDMEAIIEGIELEDGIVDVDEISYVGDGANKKEIGIQIHSGKNRVIRRLFEHLGFEVTKLDRVVFAGLTKKNIERGRWRFLTEKEINFLKML